MNVDSESIPAREQGAADHDEPYTWGLTPNMYLAQRQIAGLLVLRSRLDNRHTLRDRRHRLPRGRKIDE
ncbi:MAG TPA: hypothetical protein VGJ60_16110 [Chloroflexota bacterium]|jgi:hypothetical protein